MRSLIILEVEHGEDTDDLTEIVDAASLHCASKNLDAIWHGTTRYAKVVDYTVRVDVPACFVLDSEPDTDDGITCDECYAMNGSHFLNCSLHASNII